jgi:DNA-binding GntR family transcriptional regulator
MQFLAKTLEGIIIPLFAHRVIWRINRDILGRASILSHKHQQLLDHIEGKVDRRAEEVMLEHLSYGYRQPEPFSSLNLSAAESLQATTHG